MNRVKIILLLFIVLISARSVDAQCAMCKAVVESSSNTGNEIAEGVNSGILYLMGVPYLMVMVIGFAWYKKFHKGNNEV